MSASETEKRLQILLEATRLLSSKLELRDLLTTVMEMAARVVSAERASILLVDAKTGELYFDIALDLRKTAKTVRLKPGQGIAGWCVANAKPVIVNDVQADPRWTTVVDERSGFKTRSMIAVPIELRGTVIGVVEAINRIGGPFTEQDIRDFQGFASQCAVAIDNARLFDSVRQEKRNLQTVVDTMEEGALFCDPAGRILLSNRAARRLLGPESELKVAIAGFRMEPPLDVVLGGSGGTVLFDLARTEPPQLVLAGSALRLGTGADARGWVWIFRDVTGERREQRLKRSFLSLISHKLRTPLASIIGYTQVLLDSAIPSEARGPLAAVQRQGLKLNRLVDKLLGFVTLEGEGGRLTPSELDLDHVLREALVRVADVVGEKKLEIRRDKAPSKVWGDETLVVGLLANLIENAVKFNESPEPLVDVAFADEGRAVRVTIGDNGPGIPPEDLPKVIEGFHQVDGDFTGQIDGWGLGLSYANRVAQAHGAPLHIDSKLGAGTRVSFVLPKKR